MIRFRKKLESQLLWLICAAATAGVIYAGTRDNSLPQSPQVQLTDKLHFTAMHTTLETIHPLTHPATKQALKKYNEENRQ